MSELDSGGEEKSLAKYQGEKGTALRWLKEIDLVLNSEKQRNFEKVGEKIIKDYKNQEVYETYASGRLGPNRVMYNVLWSNVEVLNPMLFARMPNVVVEQWTDTSDPISRQAGEIAEVCTSYQLRKQQDRFMDAVSGAVKDVLLPGRGQVWLNISADFEPLLDEAGEPRVDPEGNVIKVVKPNSEKVEVSPLYWQDYIESLSRNQYEVRWRAKRSYMTRPELIERFGEKIGKAVKLQNFKEGVDRRKKLDDEESFLQQAEVWEIEDGVDKKRIWISRGYKEAPLDVRPDELKLSDFYSCPIPITATTTSDSTYPTPDFVIYERLAEEVDWITKRISSVMNCVRVVGAVSAAYSKDVKNISSLMDGQVWPVQNWTKFLEDGKSAGIIDWLPFDQAVAAINPMIEYRNECLNQINLITSIPDLAHGVSNPNETAASVQKRSFWTMPKIMIRQEMIQRFCRSIARKTCEMIFEPGIFSDETIALMYNLGQRKPEEQQMFPQALALLRNDRLSTFKIDIETDSTIAQDEADNQARWAQYMESITAVLGQVQNIMGFRPELMKPAIESCLGAIRSMRIGRNVEGAWETALKEIQDAEMQAKMNPQPPPPNPELIKAQAHMMDAQNKQFELQQDAQKTNVEIQNMMQENAANIDIKYRSLGIEERKQMFDEWFKPQELQSEDLLNEATVKIEAQKVAIETIKTENKQEIDKIDANIKTFTAQYEAALEAKLVDLKEKIANSQQIESVLEETRLARQEQDRRQHESHSRVLDTLKVHGDMIKSIKETKPQETVSAKEPMPPIHVHVGGGSKSVKIKKSADGSYVGTSEDTAKDND